MIDLKERLRSGQPVIGSWVNSGSSVVAELMAQCGFHFLCVDVEHSPVELTDVHRLFQAIRSGNPECASFVRLHGIDYSFVKRYMDAGADGVIAPLVRSEGDVVRLVEACHYPPLGARGLGFCRANDYGHRVTEVFSGARASSTLVVQIEHIDAVERIEQILSVPGIDCAFIGPFDLSASMGIPGELSHPRLAAACERVMDACRRLGVAAGIHVIEPEAEVVRQRLEQGYRFIALSLDISILGTVCRRELGSLRSSGWF